jgi:hypothetical protein
MNDEQTIILTKAGKKFWGTKKKTMRLVVTNNPVELSGCYWDGGSRDEYFAVTRSGSKRPLEATGCPGFDHRPVRSVTPTDEVAVVHGGIFCGKEMKLTAYVTTFDGWIID